MARAPLGSVRPTPHGAYDFPRAGKHHHGVDLPAQRGAVVAAPEGLRVLVVGRGLRSKRVGPKVGRYDRSGDAIAKGVGLDGYGPAAVLAVGDSGVVHVFGHLEDAALPAAGQRLREGEAVGLVSRVAHCHWEVRRRDRYPWPLANRGSDTYDPGAWLWMMEHVVPGGAPASTSLSSMLQAATSVVRGAVVGAIVGDLVWLVLGLWLLSRRRR